MENNNDILDKDLLDDATEVEVQNVISLNKFIFLCLVSYGTYEIWWMYKAWKYYKQKEKLDIVPAGRAIFAIFFLNALFGKIQDSAREKGYEKTYSTVPLFIGFFVVNAMYRLPEPYSLVSLLSFVFLIPAFHALNFEKRNSPEIILNEQTGFSNRQIGLILIGLVFWVLALYGMTDFTL